MTRLFLFLAAILFQGSASAQINNFFNAPSQYQLPGTPALPGNTPFLGTQTTTPTTYGTSGYGTPAYGTSTYGSNFYPGTGTSAFAASGGFTNPNAFPTTGFPTTNVSTAFSTPLRTTSGVFPPAGRQGAVYTQPNVVPFAPITIPVPAYAQVDPPLTWAPGLATIKDGRWIMTDFLYNLPYNIGVKVVIVKPEDRYMPLSDQLLERRIASLFEEANLVPTPYPVTCEPPLPLFLVTIMAYPCERRCVGVVTAQLYEVVQPQRIDNDLSGVWQAITWERQELVASTCDDFAQEIEATVTNMTQTFTWQYNHFNPIPERNCFPEAAAPIPRVSSRGSPRLNGANSAYSGRGSRHTH